MTRSVLTIDLKDDPRVIDAYRRHHRQVWPEVLASLQRAGVLAMEIFILGRRLVMLVETTGGDVRQILASHVASSARVAEWEALMKGMQQPVPGASAGDWWSVMEPVFQLQPAAAGSRDSA